MAQWRNPRISLNLAIIRISVANGIQIQTKIAGCGLPALRTRTNGHLTVDLGALKDALATASKRLWAFVVFLFPKSLPCGRLMNPSEKKAIALLKAAAKNEAPHSNPDGESGQSEHRHISGGVFVVGEVETHLSPCEIQKQDRAYNQEQARENKRYLFEKLTFVAVVVYAGLTAWQASTTSDIANLTQKQMILSQRPWVGTDLKATGVITINETTRKIDWLIDWKNYGNSPALRVKWHTRISTNTGDPINWEGVERSTENLGLTQTMEFTAFNGQELPNNGTSDNPISVSFEDGLISGKNKIILTGIVQYEDEFSTEPHKTTFCVLYNPPRDGFPAGWMLCPVKPLAT